MEPVRFSKPPPSATPPPHRRPAGVRKTSTCVTVSIGGGRVFGPRPARIWPNSHFSDCRSGLTSSREPKRLLLIPRVSRSAPGIVQQIVQQFHRYSFSIFESGFMRRSMRTRLKLDRQELQARSSCVHSEADSASALPRHRYFPARRRPHLLRR